MEARPSLAPHRASIQSRTLLVLRRVPVYFVEEKRGRANQEDQMFFERLTAHIATSDKNRSTKLFSQISKKTVRTKPAN
jgi:hypothetical protein